MIHPIVEDIEKIDDAVLEEKILDLTKKYFTAHRLGKPELLTQIQMIITIYKEERLRRHLTKKNDLDKDLDQLINVD